MTMKITVLTNLETENSKKFDVGAAQVAAALEQAGHKVSLFGVHSDLSKLVRGIRARKPDLIFNLLETFGSSQLGAVAAVGLLELLGIPYTGGGPGEIYLQEDKALTKKLLAFDGIAYPDFAVFSQDSSLETGGSLRMPLFVKPLRMDASIGIDAKSLVRSTTELMERVLFIHKQVKDAALVEEFVEGREFYVGVLGNQNPRAFPAIEMDFTGFPDGAPRILDSKAKWDADSPEFHGTQAVLADIPAVLQARLQKVALDAYRALRVCDYGRIDMRLTSTDQIYVIEVNASCYLEESSEFARAAAAANLDYPSLIERIVIEALNRRQQSAPVLRKKRTKKKTPSKAG